MNQVNVAIECEAEYRASIYTLVMSIVLNKNKSSKYVVYMILNNTEQGLWDDLSKVTCENVQIVFWNDNIDKLNNEKKIILLKWNTLVMGDLSELYDIDLAGNIFGAVKNSQVFSKVIPGKKEKYDTSVLLIDKQEKQKKEGYVLIPKIYNFGCEECLDAFNEDDRNDWVRAKNLACILRLDSKRPPEHFFDGRISAIWMKYYKKSPIGNEPINRKAFTDTIGNVCEKTLNAIPVFVFVQDDTVNNVTRLLDSLEKYLKLDGFLDIRLAFSQLSLDNQKRLMGLVNDKRNVVLYNVKRYTMDQWRTCKEIMGTLIFGDYKKAICINSSVVIKEDISTLYEDDMQECFIKVQKNCDDEQYDVYLGHIKKVKTDISIINIEQWLEYDILDELQKMLNSSEYEKYTVDEVLNIVFIRKRSFFQRSIMYDIVSGEIDEDNKVKEILEKVQALEKQNEKLVDINRKLKSENQRLEEEKRKLNKESEKYLYEILQIRKSATYKLGRIITFLPRKVRGDH